MEFRETLPPRSPLLVGAVLAAGPALLSLLVGPPTAFRALFCGGVLLAALGLMALGRPRRRSVIIDKKAGTIAVDGGATEPIGAGATLELVCAPPKTPAARYRYGVALCRKDAARVLLLASEDPARTLRDLSTLRRRLDLHVTAGWGLPDNGTPWADRARPSGPVTPRPFPREAREDAVGRRRIMTTLLVAAGGFTALLSMEAMDRLSQGDATATVVSLGLPLLALGAIVTVAIVIGFSEQRLDLGTALSFERRVLGVRVGHRSIDRSHIRRAYVVAADSGEPPHLLLDTDAGPVAFPSEPTEATSIASRLTAAGS